ncbi:MAG: bifunctional pyr operon transcriptional regulator/uracil phosphoribosyltransferase PyrR [Deltaproteobacteria bacterium]|jgi:pyrimidine operon attenuation protein/uracil phosphoribosyltransferase|nr:bifunctional pyr operon transcriptional regulator/uracil phosphoribosyltransferase PyrR [Deltaproteobacteria bacterium]
MSSPETILLDSNAIMRAMTRIAHEILEKNNGCTNLVLIGIRTGGDHLAQMLRQRIFDIEGIEIKQGAVDVTMYRDDISNGVVRPIGKTDIPFALDNCHVILVDEVIYTGRTIRAAMDALTDIGRPSSIQLAVLIDRGHRELPIRPDFVGRNVPSSREEKIEVVFDDTQYPTKVRLVKP